MSTTYAAYAFIGVKVPRSKLFVSVERADCAACQQRHPEHPPYCPQTGKKVRWTEERPIPALNDDLDKIQPNQSRQYPLVRQWDEGIWIAAHEPLQVSSASWKDDCSTELLPATELLSLLMDKDRLETFITDLQGLGLWEESVEGHNQHFGLWNVLTTR